VGTLVDSMRVSTLPLSYGNPAMVTGGGVGPIALTGNCDPVKASGWEPLGGGPHDRIGVGVFVGDPRLDRPFEPTHIVNYAMSGTRGDQSDITIDGGLPPPKAAPTSLRLMCPPPMRWAEFKVQTATFDASFGQTLAA